MNTITLKNLSEYNASLDNTVTLPYGAFDITVKTWIPVSKQLWFVQSIVDAVLEDSIAEYSVLKKSMLVHILFAEVFTNIPLPQKTIKDKDGQSQKIIDTEKLYEWCERMDLIHQARAASSALDRLFTHLEQAIDAQLHMAVCKQQAMVSSNPAAAKALESLNTLIINGIGLINQASEQLINNTNTQEKIPTA